MEQNTGSVENIAVRRSWTLSSEQLRTALLVVAFAYAPLASFVSGVFHHLPIIGSYSDYVVPGMIILLVGFNLPKIVRLVSHKDVIAAFVLVSIIIFTLIIYPTNEQYIKQNIMELLLHAVPYYFVGLLWRDDEETFHLIYKVSLLAIVVNTLYFIFFVSQSDKFIYSMTIAYAVLPSIMVCLWWLVEQKKKIALMGVGIGVFLLLFLGTRGPVMVFICYTAFLLWSKYKTRGKFFLIIIAALLVYSIIYTRAVDVVTQALSIFGGSRGYSTRIFDILSRNELFTYTSGRSTYYEIVTQKILERPLLGYGIYGEWQFIQNPAHRIWLEIWSHYGIIFGTILIFFFLYLMRMGIKYSSNIYVKGFIWIWIIHLIIRGIFGATYLGFYCFFLWGICCNQIRKNRRKG